MARFREGGQHYAFVEDRMQKTILPLFAAAAGKKLPPEYDEILGWYRPKELELDPKYHRLEYKKWEIQRYIAECQTEKAKEMAKKASIEALALVESDADATDAAKQQAKDTAEAAAQAVAKPDVSLPHDLFSHYLEGQTVTKLLRPSAKKLWQQYGGKRYYASKDNKPELKHHIYTSFVNGRGTLQAQPSVEKAMFAFNQWLKANQFPKMVKPKKKFVVGEPPEPKSKMTLLEAYDIVMAFGEEKAVKLLSTLLWDHKVRFPMGDEKPADPEPDPMMVAADA